jgi:hypothetical protein
MQTLIIIIIIACLVAIALVDAIIHKRFKLFRSKPRRYKPGTPNLSEAKYRERSDSGPKPETRNKEPETKNKEQETRNKEQETRNPEPETLNPEPIGELQPLYHHKAQRWVIVRQFSDGSTPQLVGRSTYANIFSCMNKINKLKEKQHAN